jgi:hypothetical protein
MRRRSQGLKRGFAIAGLWMGIISLIMALYVTMSPVLISTGVDDAGSSAPETSSTGQVSDSISESERDITGNDSVEEYENNPPADDENNEYILPHSDTGWISESDLNSLSERELTLARNEIYARHGAIFKTVEIQSYFDVQPWYISIEKKKAVDKIKLNDTERSNAEYIRDYAEDAYGRSSYYK